MLRGQSCRSQGHSNCHVISVVCSCTNLSESIADLTLKLWLASAIWVHAPPQMVEPAASVRAPVHVGKDVAKQLKSAAAHALVALLERHVRAAGKGDVAEHRELAICHQHGLHEQAPCVRYIRISIVRA